MDATRRLTNYALLAGLALFASGCEKTPNKAPERDTEFQSSADISYANQVISDVEMICSFVAEDDLAPKFYMAAPGETPVTPNRNVQNQQLFISFNNTKCLDGKVRNGTIAMSFQNADPNAVYLHRYGFKGNVTLVNYRVDGWQVGLKNTFTISNNLSSPNFDPKKTNLSWKLNGDFTLSNAAEPGRNMRCNIDLVKTLANTADAAVFTANRPIAITWSLATVQYQGSIFGETSGNVPFTYKIDDKNPLTRDFSCYPDKVAAVTLNPNLSVRYDEYHPIVKGVAEFKTGELYPRKIAYGNEQGEYGDMANNPQMLSQQCDNKAVVTIKGISYPLDLKK